MTGSLVSPGGGTMAPAVKSSRTTSTWLARIARTIGVHPVLMSVDPISRVLFRFEMCMHVPSCSSCSNPLDKTALTSSN